MERKACHLSDDKSHDIFKLYMSGNNMRSISKMLAIPRKTIAIKYHANFQKNGKYQEEANVCGKERGISITFTEYISYLKNPALDRSLTRCISITMHITQSS